MIMIDSCGTVYYILEFTLKFLKMLSYHIWNDDSLHVIILMAHLMWDPTILVCNTLYTSVYIKQFVLNILL